jgi:hydrogenase maturation factor
MKRNKIRLLPFGKIPPNILESSVFPYLGASREDVLLGPARGEDASIVKADDILVASSCDPVTGSEKWMGWLAVHVTANDVSTLGVQPRWFNSCILLPETDDNEKLVMISQQVDEAAKELGVAVIGGHCEVTPGLSHPIIIGFCMGVTKEGDYITSSGAKSGGKIILTKGVALEGTAILCTDRRDLVKRFLGNEVQQKGAEYIRMISVVKDALAAVSIGGVQAMHDPTEGGVAGGLHELSDASKCGFKIYEEYLLIKSETRKICNLFRINPLNLISSGALVIVIDEDKATPLLNYLHKLSIDASIIGEIVDDPTYRKIVTEHDKIVDLSRPDTDELWDALGKGIHDLEDSR